MIILGMTWGHSRGLVPLQATAQRFAERHPGISVQWEARSLKDFEEFSIQELARKYDMIVIDHPFIGEAAKQKVFLPLDEHLLPGFLAEQSQHSVGASHESYCYDGHQLALAIDAATPVAMWRSDLLQRHHLEVPQRWDEVLEMARHGMVEIPALPINNILNFLSLCVASGEEPFLDTERVVSEDAGRQALEALAELIRMCSPECLDRNPFHSCEIMAREGQDRIAYCPLAYGYSNYAREGYAAHLLTFGDVPLYRNGQAMRSTLGGTGLAISAQTRHPQPCLAYAQFVADPEVQRTLYARNGGQPGHRKAWLDPENNRITHDYFLKTLPALDRAYLRPRYPGYMKFQEHGGALVSDYVMKKKGALETLASLNHVYRSSLST